VVELSLDIFNEEHIVFESDSEIISKIDRTQLIRIITNLVKKPFNQYQNNRKIKGFNVKDLNNVLIIVEDNGIGIKPEY
jgi:sensor histidine kinase regulating citrate/malate metabolism